MMPAHGPIDSSVIADLDYAPDHALLEVTFHTGRVYRYFLVPPSVYAELTTASSIGRYFNQNIRNRYRYEEVAGGSGGDAP